MSKTPAGYTWDELGIEIHEGTSQDVPHGCEREEEAEDLRCLSWAVEESLRAREEGRLRDAERWERDADDLLSGIVARYMPYNPYNPYGEA